MSRGDAGNRQSKYGADLTSYQAHEQRGLPRGTWCAPPTAGCRGAAAAATRYDIDRENRQERACLSRDGRKRTNLRLSFVNFLILDVTRQGKTKNVLPTTYYSIYLALISRSLFAF